MSEAGRACVIMTTCGSDDEARLLARALVDARVAACVQRLAIHSTYRWEGAVHDDPEVLLLIKTTRERYTDVAAYLAEHHSYDEPEILLLPVEAGSEGYLGWLEATLSGAGGD